jgi:hypothetical protein
MLTAQTASRCELAYNMAAAHWVAAKASSSSVNAAGQAKDVVAGAMCDMMGIATDSESFLPAFAAGCCCRCCGRAFPSAACIAQTSGKAETWLLFYFVSADADRAACVTGITALLPAPLAAGDALTAATAQSYANSVYARCIDAYGTKSTATPAPPTSTAWVLQKAAPYVWQASPALAQDAGSCRPLVVTTCAVSGQYKGCDATKCATPK